MVAMAVVDTVAFAITFSTFVSFFALRCVAQWIMDIVTVRNPPEWDNRDEQ